MDTCPCGSGKAYGACCEPYHKGTLAPTAEALMRARYSAYAKQQIPFLLSTITSNNEDERIDADATRQWSEEADWKGLDILRTEKGTPTDTEGVVEFRANYVQKGILEHHHEVAAFVKKDGAWFYETGKLVQETRVRVEAKQGRNDPCACGSGKKYKHCHGR